MSVIEFTKKVARQYFEARDQAIQDALNAFERLAGDKTPAEELAKSGRAVLVRYIDRPYREMLRIDGRDMVTFTIGDTEVARPGEPIIAWKIESHY